MRQLVRRHRNFFVLATAAAFALRLIFFWKLRFVSGDSFIYGDLAKNWLRYGVYGMGDAGGPQPTDLRLPGYPAFLTLIWLFTGAEHYHAVIWAQIFIDIATGFLVAALAVHVASEGAARRAFLFAVLCPFTANYAVTPLTETLAVFFSALVLLCAVEALDGGASGWWIACGVAIGISTLLRPDGGLLLPAVELYIVICLARGPKRLRAFTPLVLVAVFSLLPLLPWTIRNWRDFHRFAPLAPRYANNPDEYVPVGFIRWLKTWIVDYASVEDVYWHIPGEPLDVSLLPPRAFDNEEQRQKTTELFHQYNATLRPIPPELDARFAALARCRIAHSPLRYYLELPFLRVADMWLRPRVEALPIDPHLWPWDPQDSPWSILLGTINLALVTTAIIGLVRRRTSYTLLFSIWLIMRCILLGTLENPEPRYTLECFPLVFVLAAANWRNND